MPASIAARPSLDQKPYRLKTPQACERLGIGRSKLEELLALDVFTVQRDGNSGHRWLFADELNFWLESAGEYEDRVASLRNLRIRRGRIK